MLNLSFSPSSLGPKSATLHILNNIAGSSGSFDLSLRGVGLTRLENWRQTWFGTYENIGDGANDADVDVDGISNLLEYALALNPREPSNTLLPQPVIKGESLELSFDHPLDVDGITYSAEWSTTLESEDWHAVQDSGTAGKHLFTAPINGLPKLFMRIVTTTL